MGTVRVTLSEDRLAAYLELDGPVPLAEVEREIAAAGVVEGVMQDRVQGAVALCRSRGSLPRPVRIAEGKAPVPGVPSRFELGMDLARRAGSMNLESHQIDYRERGGVCNVSAGQVLGFKISGIPGQAGMGVDGKPVPPPGGDESKAKVGEGVVSGETKEGRTVLTAEIDGILRQLPDGELVVLEELEIDGDVDMDTGNLDVNGSLVIHGSVRAGFRVTARRHLTVDTTIEGARVEAGGSVDVGRGILGGSEGEVIAGGSVRFTFGQNATIRCRGDVVLESDTRSRIEAGGKIVAREGGGHLIGGFYWAGKGVTVRELGSPQGVPTVVVVGSDPALIRELSRVRKELANLRARTNRGPERADLALDPERAKDVRAAMRVRLELGEAEAQLERREAELVAALQLDDLPNVRVDGNVYPGVEIRILDAHLFIDQPGPGGLYRLDPQSGKIVK